MAGFETKLCNYQNLYKHVLPLYVHGLLGQGKLGCVSAFK